MNDELLHLTSRQILEALKIIYERTRRESVWEPFDRNVAQLIP
jgi:hypothetical protein